jgi:hypothetical protein
MWYAALATVSGLLGALLPERVIGLGARLGLGPLYENTGELEPRPWYVRATRIQSLGLAIAGVLALLVGRSGSPAGEAEPPDQEETTTGTA